MLYKQVKKIKELSSAGTGNLNFTPMKHLEKRTIASCPTSFKYFIQ